MRWEALRWCGKPLFEAVVFAPLYPICSSEKYSSPGGGIIYLVYMHLDAFFLLKPNLGVWTSLLAFLFQSEVIALPLVESFIKILRLPCLALGVVRLAFSHCILRQQTSTTLD